MIRLNNYYTKLVLLLTFAFAFWCVAEDFLVTHPHAKRKSLSQIRQEIVETLASLVQQESKSIELQAQVQQLLYKYIEELAQGEKKSFFATASRDQLLKYLQVLNERKSLNEREHTALMKFLETARNARTL
jgi:tRNA C32,U32 (ribose-2'-O)-methylase TrmJ